MPHSLKRTQDLSYDLPPADERKGETGAESDRNLGNPTVTHQSTLIRYPASTMAPPRRKNVAGMEPGLHKPDSPAAFLESSRGRLQNVTFSASRLLPGAPMVPTMKDITPKKPAKRALAALDQTEPAVDTRIRQRPISKRVNTAIDHLVAGGVKTIKEAAEKVGMPRESLSRALSTPHVAEHLRTKVMKVDRHGCRARRRRQGRSARFRNAIARDRASSFILGLAGIQPATNPSVSVNLGVRCGYVIDLTDDPPPMRTISHE